MRAEEILLILVFACFGGWMCFMFGRIYEKEKLSAQYNEMKDEAAKYRALYELMGGKP